MVFEGVSKFLKTFLVWVLCLKTLDRTMFPTLPLNNTTPSVEHRIRITIDGRLP